MAAFPLLARRIDVSDQLMRAIRPPTYAHAVTPHDTNALSGVSVEDGRPFARGVYVGVSGDVEVIMPSGVTVVFTALAAGVIHPIACTHIKDANTTATSVVACY